ncbi:MAG: alpha-amylase, partial [Muribaculaceae bacterium]|nr:alpha-amylase [Muribaculaceae bacterium]
LYDKVNLYDTLVDIEIHNHSAARLTGAWQTVDGIGDSMLNFLENHDEVRFGSKAYAGNPANVLPSLVVSAMISRGPFMIYYGQELGESARDNEGFAGDNNRSTIFDYWSYDTLRRWWNNGRPSLKHLTPQEKWLRGVYQRVLTLCNSEPALREGSFFDLMYVNLRHEGFNPHSQFAFLRYTEESVLLIVVNFDNSEADVDVVIPRLAFEMSGLHESDVLADDMLCGRSAFVRLSPDQGTRVHLKPKDAVVLRIK